MRNSLMPVGPYHTKQASSQMSMSSVPDGHGRTVSLLPPVGGQNLTKFLDGISKELQQPSSTFNPFVFWDEPSDKLAEWNDTIEEAIDEAVDQNYKGFNQSTEAFNDILKYFKDSDKRLRHVINNLAESKKLLGETSVAGGKTQVISELWQRAQEYKNKLELYDKIEYFLEIPIIYEKYRSQCQYVHCSVLLKDGLQLWSEWLFEDVGLQAALADIKQFQNALKEELIDEITCHLYFKTDQLRDFILYRQSRYKNKNKHSLQDMKKMSDIGPNKSLPFENDKDGDNASSNKYHKRGRNGKKSNTGPAGNAGAAAGATAASVLADPTKVIVPTYSTFRQIGKDVNGTDSSNNNAAAAEEMKNDINSEISSDLREYLINETNDNYIKEPVKDVKLFLEICACAFDQLPNAASTKKKFLTQLKGELSEVIERELNITQFEYASPNDKLSRSQQTSILLEATENAFKIYERVLSNHKTVLKVFDYNKNYELSRMSVSSKRRSQEDVAYGSAYSLETVWNEMSQVIKVFLEKYLNVNDPNSSITVTTSLVNDSSNSIVDDLLNSSSDQKSGAGGSGGLAGLGGLGGAGGDDMNDKSSSRMNISNMLKGNKFFRTFAKSQGDELQAADEVDVTDMNIGGNLSGLDISSLEHIGMKDENLDRAHYIATQQLTFSFSDSNVHSIVKGASGIYGAKDHHKTATEFAATNRKRLSLTGLTLEDGSVVSNVMAQAAKIGANENGFKSRHGSSTGAVGSIVSMGYGMNYGMGGSSSGGMASVSGMVSGGSFGVLGAGAMRRGGYQTGLARNVNDRKYNSRKIQSAHGSHGAHNRSRRGRSKGRSQRNGHKSKSRNRSKNGLKKNELNKNRYRYWKGRERGDDKILNQQSKKFNRLLRSMNKIEPTPYHIAALYRPVVLFIDSVENVFFDRLTASLSSLHGSNDSKNQSKMSGLRSFLKNFVSNIFVPKVVEDASQWLIDIISSPGALDQIKIVEDECSLIRSVSQIYELIETTFDHFKMIPIFDDNEFAAIILRILDKLIDMCNWVSKEMGESFQSKKILLKGRDDDYMKFMKLFDLRKMLDTWTVLDDNLSNGSSEIINFNNGSYSYSSNSKIDTLMKKLAEEGVYTPLIGTAASNNSAGGSRSKNTAFSQHSGFDTLLLSFAQLGNMATGLFWISQKIELNLINELKANASGKNAKANSKGKGKLSNSAAVLNSNSMEEIINCLHSRCQPLSEHCLSMIRIELRCQCVWYLRNILNINYCLPDDKITKPQDFIITLNKLLVNCESKLNESLPKHLVKFIFVELSYFINDLIIYLIPKILGKKLNYHGYKQLWRNIFSLQQNLTTITQDSKEKCFDKSQKFLELTMKDPKEIDILMKKSKQYFIKHPNKRNNAHMMLNVKKQKTLVNKSNPKDKGSNAKINSDENHVTTTTLLLNYSKDYFSGFDCLSSENVNHLLKKFESELDRSYQSFFTDEQYLAVKEVAKQSHKKVYI